jgi:hypothetical protein
MNNKSIDLSNKVLNLVFQGTTFTSPGPSNIYFGLLTSPPTDTNIVELTPGNGYARANVTFSVAGGTNPPGTPQQTQGLVYNTSQIVIGPALAAWGPITGFGLWDDPTAGNLLYWGEISPALNATLGYIFPVLPYNLIIGED